VHDYSRIRKEHGRRVSQTIDSPIMIVDVWELSEAFAAIFVVLTLGVIAYAWGAMCAALLIVLVAVPVIKKKHHRGIFLHWPYRRMRVSLPGLINPRGRRKFSD
jgi:hypothetical protein